MEGEESSSAQRAAKLPWETVNAERLRDMLDQSAAIGRDASRGEGLYRTALSANDMAGRKWLKQTLTSLGLEVFQDGALNIHGRLGGQQLPTDAPVVMTGSHHDSVSNGGALDGALGVIAGVEALARIRELGYGPKLQCALEVVDFTDEEGRFGGMLGSMCLAGKITTAEDVLKLASADGERAARLLALRAREDAAAAADDDDDGKEEKEPPLAVSEEEEYKAAEAAVGACCDRHGNRIHPKAYVELHIEQGPVLDEAGESVGVVTGICGLWKAQLTYRGQANHAGTTPMHMRRNAFEGCAAMQTAIPRLLSQYGGPQTVCTIGSVSVIPNAANVVPGECTFTLELRDERQDVVDAMASAVRDTAALIADEHRLDLTELRQMSAMPPARAHRDVIACIRQASADAGLENVRLMPSGAAHDAQQLATVAPMGMIFVPSINGISHNPAEATDFEHILVGANVLLNTLLRLAMGEAKVSADADSGGDGNAPERGATQTMTQTGHSPIDADAPPPAMATGTVGWNGAALLCIDLQQMPPSSARDGVDFDTTDQAYFDSHTPALLENVAAVQQYARSLGTPRGPPGSAAMELVHCRIMSMTQDGRDRSTLHKRMGIHVPPAHRDGGARGGAWMANVGPQGDELVFNKTGSNAFATTNLHYVLGNLGVHRLVCVGVLTDECVASTVKTAADLGYDCTVLEDACLAATPDRHSAALKTLSRFADVTTTKEWLSRSSPSGFSPGVAQTLRTRVAGSGDGNGGRGGDADGDSKQVDGGV